MDAEERKGAAVEFLKLSSSGRAREAAKRFLAPGGVHHNPYFAAGWDSLITAMEENAKAAPERRFDVKRVLCDGDYVAVHSHVTHRPGEAGAAVVHIFRFEGGKIAEMWDVGQSIPADSPNRDGPF
ncbi:MAG TPA: nuclear transport factor 2 family protein [Candidatus Bilamarchaeum sp.]|nr:nuclear transport factor 2 family protein [Candidatus Bilamarchaeum sp.]